MSRNQIILCITFITVHILPGFDTVQLMLFTFLIILGFIFMRNLIILSSFCQFFLTLKLFILLLVFWEVLIISWWVMNLLLWLAINFFFLILFYPLIWSVFTVIASAFLLENLDLLLIFIFSGIMMRLISLISLVVIFIHYRKYNF